MLSTPPAFNLSQDQTLHLKILKIIIEKSGSKRPNYCWTFWSLRSLHLRHRRESPHKLPAKLLKSASVAGAEVRGANYTPLFQSVNHQFSAGCLGQFCEAVQAREGAQYSDSFRVVNALQYSCFRSGPNGFYAQVSTRFFGALRRRLRDFCSELYAREPARTYLDNVLCADGED